MNASETILDNLPDAVLLVNAGGIIIYANRQAERLFGRAAAALQGQPFGFPLRPHTEQEIELLRAGHLVTAQLRANEVEWQGQKASLLSIRDITKQKRTSNELDEQRQRLEITSEENAQFASLASHDLREPVRKILTFSGRLLQHELQPEVRDLVERVASSANRMRALITGIADLSSVGRAEPVFEQVDLSRVLAEVCGDLELQIEETGASISRGDLPEIEAVPGAMYQLLLNLVANALKYRRDGVAPSITLRHLPAPEGWVEFSCSDNGVGFPNSEAETMFQAFRRLHGKQFEGTGIGLALCRKIVDLHGGSIRAEGRPGEGATFYVRLPERQGA
ncbi:MAG: PAS domain S-box protein [Chitinophagaceae bacterium]|nr:MAG: PAS domain S-box protein [Chitinophagaceae bacterium]